MENNIKRRIKKVLVETYNNSDEKSIYHLLESLKSSDNVYFETNDATLRRTLDIRDKSENLNLDAMLALCQYYQIDLNSLLNIDLKQNRIQTECGNSLEQQLFYVYLYIEKEFCSGTIRFLKSGVATLTINHSFKSSIKLYLSNEHYVGNYKRINVSDTYLLELNRTTITGKSNWFKYLEKESVYILFSINNIIDNKFNKGYLCSINDETVAVCPIVVSAKELHNVAQNSIDRGLNILSTNIIISGTDLMTTISDFFSTLQLFNHDKEDKDLAMQRLSFEVTIGQYLIEHGQLSSNEAVTITSVKPDKLYHLDEKDLLEYIWKYHKNKDYDKFVKRLKSKSVAINSIINRLNDKQEFFDT